MAQQPFYKGIPQKKTTPTNVAPGTVAKQVFSQSVEDAKKGVSKEIPDIVLREKSPKQLEARNKKKEFERKQKIETPVRITTSHGDKWAMVAGYENLSVAEKIAKRNALSKEYDAEMASRGVKPTRNAPVQLASPDEAVTENGAMFQNAKEAVYGAINTGGNIVANTLPGFQGFEAARKIAGKPGSDTLRGVSKFVKNVEDTATGGLAKDVKGATGTAWDLLDPSMLVAGMIHAPSDVLGSMADVVDPRVDRVGQIQGGLEVGSTVAPQTLALKAGIKSFKNFRAMQKGLRESVDAGVKSAVT